MTDRTLEKTEFDHIMNGLRITGDTITITLTLWETSHSFSTRHSYEGILTFLEGFKRTNGLDLYLDDSILDSLTHKIDLHIGRDQN